MIYCWIWLALCRMPTTAPCIRRQSWVAFASDYIPCFLPQKCCSQGHGRQQKLITEYQMIGQNVFNAFLPNNVKVENKCMAIETFHRMISDRRSCIASKYTHKIAWDNKCSPTLLYSTVWRATVKLMQRPRLFCLCVQTNEWFYLIL